MAQRQGKQLCLVIGGCGFLGRHLVEELGERGYDVRILDIRKTFTDPRFDFVIGDICENEVLERATQGVWCVFHCASPSPLSNNRDLFLKVNLHGTRSVIQACRKAGVKRLVLTSSASVVYEGRDILNGKEELPYASQPIDYYTQTKILQEQEVLTSNDSELHTVAIRPHGIFGPRDPHLVPTAVDMARKGKMKFIIGNGENVVDFTYVLNVVHGHILAAQALKPDSPACGLAFHITNDDPVKFWTFMGRVLVGLGYPPPQWRLPYWLLYWVAVVVEVVCKLLSPLVTITPTFTPMKIALAATHHSYSCARAKELLGYRPLVNMDKAIDLTLKDFEHFRNTAELRTGTKKEKD